MTDTQVNPLFSLAADIKLTLGHIKNAVDAQTEQYKKLARRASQPVFYTYSDVVTIPASGFGVVRLTGPDQGHVWYVMNLVVGGLTPTVVAAGRADVFVSAADARSRTSLGQFALTDWRDQATTLPNIAFYSSEQLVLRHNEELYIAISNATSGQQYVAAAHVTDFEEAANKQAWSM